MSEEHQKKIHRWFWAPEETHINRHIRRTSEEKHIDGFGLRRRRILIDMFEGHQKNVNISCGLRRRHLLIGMSEGHHQIKPMVLGSGGDSY
jgi:hypothetical protein